MGWKWLVRGVLGLLAVVGVTLVYVLNSYRPVPVDPAWQVSGSATSGSGTVTVRFTGTSTLLFSDGETSWMVDGWFSRPGPLALLAGPIGPDLDAIEAGLAANGVTELAAVIPVHSHYDHAMDAPEVARRTGALLLGSEATANIGRGWGLPENQIRVLEDRESLALGRFTLTAIASRHFQFPDPAVRERALAEPHITEPLVPPVPVFDYRVGVPWVLHVTHPAGSWLIVGSAGFIEAGLVGYRADTVFLGVGGLGSQTDRYRRDYWRETVGTVEPRRVIPIHYDSLTGPIEGPFRGPVLAMAFLSDGTEETLAFLREQAAANPGIEFLTLPRYEAVSLYP